MKHVFLGLRVCGNCKVIKCRGGHGSVSEAAVNYDVCVQMLFRAVCTSVVNMKFFENGIC